MNYPKIKTLVLHALQSCAMVASLPGMLLAQESGTFHEEIIPPSSVTARFFALGESDLETGGSSYATSQAGLEASLWHWQIAVSRQYFSWENADEFIEDTGGEDPWEYLNQVRLGFSHAFVHSDRWSSQWFAGGIMGFEKEVSDSFAGYLGGYATYQINDRLMLLGGFFYSKHQKVSTDFDFIPVVGILWNPGAVRGFSASLGLPETRAIWHFSEATRLGVELKTIEGGVTRLADDNPVREGGYVELISASVVVRLETRIGQNWELSVGVGHSVHREMKLYDADGGNERTVDVERAPGFEFSVSRSF